MGRFIMKHIDNRKPQVRATVVKNNNKEVINEKVMTTNEKIAMAQDVLNGVVATKRIKKDKGLIERTESSKTILTEDNKELLND